MTLYEMTEQARALYDLLQEGEIDEQTLADTLEAIGADQKVDSYCKIIRQYEADIEGIKMELERLREKKRIAENAVLRLKDGLYAFMEAQHTEKVDTGLFKASLGESKAVEVIDPSKVPLEFREVMPDKIDKFAVRKLLMEGKTVDGCTLKTTKVVRIK